MFTVTARAVYFLTLLITLAACSGSDGNASSTASISDGEEAAAASQSAASADPSRNAVYQKGLALVAQSDCLTCHKIEEKMTGPSYRAIAEKYAGAPNDVVTALAKTIINGGVGNWGNIPMTAHSTLSQDDAETMVRYILELNKK